MRMGAQGGATIGQIMEGGGFAAVHPVFEASEIRMRDGRGYAGDFEAALMGLVLNAGGSKRHTGFILSGDDAQGGE